MEPLTFKEGQEIGAFTVDEITRNSLFSNKWKQCLQLHLFLLEYYLILLNENFYKYNKENKDSFTSENSLKVDWE